MLGHLPGQETGDMRRERIIAVQGVCEEGKEDQEEKLEQELEGEGK